MCRKEDFCGKKTMKRRSFQRDGRIALAQETLNKHRLRQHQANLRLQQHEATMSPTAAFLVGRAVKRPSTSVSSQLEALIYAHKPAK